MENYVVTLQIFNCDEPHTQTYYCVKLPINLSEYAQDYNIICSSEKSLVFSHNKIIYRFIQYNKSKKVEYTEKSRDDDWVEIVKVTPPIHQTKRFSLDLPSEKIKQKVNVLADKCLAPVGLQAQPLDKINKVDQVIYHKKILSPNFSLIDTSTWNINGIEFNKGDIQYHTLIPLNELETLGFKSLGICPEKCKNDTCNRYRYYKSDVNPRIIFCGLSYVKKVIFSIHYYKKLYDVLKS